MLSNVLLVFLCIIAYIAGLVIIFRTTPVLLARAYDEGLFMAIAALDIVGAILAFSGVVVPLLIYNAAIAVRILAFVLLLGILFIAARLGLFSLNAHSRSSSFRVSRILVGCYCLFLIGGSIYYMIQIFTA